MPSTIHYMYICLTVEVLSVCPDLADRKLSNVDLLEVESFDLFKSMLCSEQANVRVL